MVSHGEYKKIYKENFVGADCVILEGCELQNPDTNNNDKVDSKELLNYIDLWQEQTITTYSLLDAIHKWQNS